ncbi:hypothetical protein FRC05_006539 [Tulasnella sp. 425]|nr:hypothetical protein FRC05_006539 [Tulasnella sp. 425]
MTLYILGLSTSTFIRSKTPQALLDASRTTITTDDGLTLDRTALNRLDIREKALGRGGYGVIKLAELVSDDRSTGGSVTVAVKVLQTDDSSALPLRVAYRLTREMIAWSACHHENILPFIGYFLSRDVETAYLVPPFVRNGNVKDYLANKQAKPEELELYEILSKGCNPYGLSAARLEATSPGTSSRAPDTANIVLNQLPNVLVNDDRRAVLCDFGLAAVVREGRRGLTTSADFRGSTRWCSREVLMGEERRLKTDIWGWACLALEIMTRNPPYHDIKNDAGVILIVCSDDHSKRKTREPTPSPTFPNGLLDILRKCWDFEPDKRPDVCTCVAVISPVPQAGTVRVWEEASWLDGWIMQYIPMFENTIQGCISQVTLDADVAQKFCQLSLLSRMKLEEELQDIKTSLSKIQNGQPLPPLTNKYLKLRAAAIGEEIDVRRQQLVMTATGFVRARSLSAPARHSMARDPVGKILRDISTLRRRVRLSREQVGETLRELHNLLKDEVAPFDNSQYLYSALPGFERLVRHYPDDWHPDVARFLLDVYYEHYVRRENHVLCLEVALQAAERYRELSRTNGIFLSRRAGALEKVAVSYEILSLHGSARAALAEAIWVYQQLNNTTGNHQAFQIPLARTLVR